MRNEIESKGRFVQEADDPQLFKALFKTPSARQLLTLKFDSRPNQVLPGLDAADPGYLRFISELADELDATFPMTYTSDGFASNDGIIRDFGMLKSVSGLKGKPAGHVYHDNSVSREVAGLRSSFRNGEDLDLFHELIDCLFSKAEYSSIKVADKSSSGLPFRTFDKASKIARAKFVLSHADEVISLMARGDLKELFNSFEVASIYVQNFRVSADSFNKKRYMPDLKYSLSFGKEGELREIDRQIPLEKFNLQGSGVKACRPRLVMGMTNEVNVLLATFYRSVENFYLSEYTYTYKHKGINDLSDKLNAYLHEYDKGQLAGIDVTQFDTTVPDFFFDAFYDYISGRYVSEEYAEMMRVAYRSPTFMRDVGDGVGPGFHGHPFKDLLPSPGVRSGNTDVSTMGKLYNTFVFLVAVKDMTTISISEQKRLQEVVVNEGLQTTIDKYTPSSNERENVVLGAVASFLKGTRSIRLINNGDDGIGCFPSSGHACEFFYRMKVAGYLKVDLEKSLKFSGFAFARLKDGTVKGYHDIASFLVNTFVPERSWNSKFRTYWPIGLRDRHLIYQDNPAFTGVLDIVDKHFYKLKNQTFRGYSEYLLRENAHLLQVVDGDITYAERLFIENPDVIHYKIDPNDIRAELLESFFSNISVDDYKHLIGKHLFMENVK